MKYTPIFVAHFYQDGTEALLCKADACKHIRPNGGAHKMQRDVRRREQQRSNRAKSMDLFVARASPDSNV